MPLIALWFVLPPIEAQGTAIDDDLWIGLDHDKAMVFGADDQRLELIRQRKTGQVA